MSAAVLDDDVMADALAHWETRGAAMAQSCAPDALLERLRQVLAALERQNKGTARLDLLSLVRQWQLRRASRGAPAWLRVPDSGGWPSCAVWRSAGFDAAGVDGGIEISAAHPRLPWLGAQDDLLDDAFDEVQVRRTDWVLAEPCIAQATGLSNFTGPGQREAVRALLHLPPQVTLIANLPTGSGKSLLAQLPALLRREGYLTLVIVPTVALSIDQGARMAELLRRKDPRWEDRPLAYHGGLTTAQRAQIFQGLREGSLPVLFTSPEAATSTLREALEDGARNGRITHVVVDEVHLVSSWGNGFRPAFQLLPALVERLRHLSHESVRRSIRVVLASATLTPHTVRFLQHAFGGPERALVVGGIYLRPEPRYAVRRCADQVEKQRLAVEALKVAPRPFILYVTRPEEAKQWLDLLREEGFLRVGQFTGATPPSERQALLDDWRHNRLDGMVATSAFGLGVDKADVRTIVHATLPESLDRFYQEVGRSGRDGRAAASLLLFTPQDVTRARGMAGESFIGNEIGFDRWTTMIDNPVAKSPSRAEVWLDLDRLRPDLRTRGRGNRTWNLRTLNLMAAAGLIEVAGLSRLAPSSDGKNLDESQEITDVQAHFAAVRILDAGHRQRAVFDARMHEARQQAKQAADQAFNLMLDVAEGRAVMEEALSRLYRLALPNAWVPVASVCGGCPAHWSAPRLRDYVPKPFVARLSLFEERCDPEVLLPTLPRAQSNLIFVVVDDVRRLLRASPSGLVDALINRLQPHTVLLPLGAGEPDVEGLRNSLRRVSSDAFLDSFDRDALDGASGEIRLVFWTDPTMLPIAASQLTGASCSLTVVLMTSAITDPLRPDRSWASVLPHADEDTALRALAS
ncbi:MAG: ATP-dependent DNA helicase RecQ [Burkholderiales bacterium]|nr:ATP-dependent DNA helicase RecQ [Roseateles sp.]MBV8658498.1 ATP-dependent DNA helicase RecQ [Burkholderiales bacterium]